MVSRIHFHPQRRRFAAWEIPLYMPHVDASDNSGAAGFDMWPLIETRWSLRDIQILMPPCPWDESHGYPRNLAPRGGIRLPRSAKGPLGKSLSV